MSVAVGVSPASAQLPWCEGAPSVDETALATPLASLDPMVCGLSALGARESLLGPGSTDWARGLAYGEPPSRFDAVEAWERVRTILAEGSNDPAAAARVGEGLVLVESLASEVPELADVWALAGAQLDHLDGATRDTCARYDAALASPLPSVALEARVGHVRCLLDVGDRHAEEALATLERRYPELPHRVPLALARAQMLERGGDLRGAVSAYRAIDLDHPGAPEAAIARMSLASLGDPSREGHVRVPSYSPLELVARADRLVRSGPPDLARTEVDRLLGERLPTAQAAELRLLAARLARVEGRFEDARGLMREARGLAPSVGEDPEAVANAAADLEAAARRTEAEARAELRAMGFGRGMRRASATRLYLMTQVAARAGLGEELASILDELIRRAALPEGLSCIVRQDTAIVAAGSDDARVAQLLEGCDTLTARYHRARALDRSGAHRAARIAYRAVIASDDTDTGFYALWARTRLAALDAHPGASEAEVEDAEHDAPITGDAEASTEVSAFSLGDASSDPTFSLAAPAPNFTPVFWDTSRLEGASVSSSTTWSLGSPLGDDKLGVRAGGPASGAPVLSGLPALHDPIVHGTGGSADEVAPPTEPEMLEPEPSEAITDDEALEILGGLTNEHGGAFPWLGRARARLVLGDTIGAAEELFLAWAAWREATGGAPIRAGAEAVYRGAAPPRVPTDLTTRRARRALSPIDRERLADVAAHLGDHGLAARFGGPERIAMRPRPYPELVRAAAARYGLDPNLVWAVMRVESIYNPSIVSYAGAIGLLQIMPRTGRLIANALGRTDFSTADLLDPATNIDFGAWYLRSLLDRFDGRLALAIAAYNGGPHNVRRWMAGHASAMPVDALCERIPFTQTHRYVRRVLHHYAAYRDADGLGLPELLDTLPGTAVDTVAF